MHLKFNLLYFPVDGFRVIRQKHVKNVWQPMSAITPEKQHFELYVTYIYIYYI